jgi:hypothetical protein
MGSPQTPNSEMLAQLRTVMQLEMLDRSQPLISQAGTSR